MWSECGCGVPRIRVTGARIDGEGWVRYKTPLRRKSLSQQKISPLVRYKTRCACKALF
jgi:hypothetical protein